MEGRGIFNYTQFDDYIVTIEYQIYWDEGSYDVAPESELTIVKVILEQDGVETLITNLYEDHLQNSHIANELFAYAWENKDNV